MPTYQKDFESFDGKIWLNAASEGPLPRVAARSLREAVHWKSHPYLLDIPKFTAVPKELKESIGQLIGVNPRDVILANSASYGLHILADGLPWAAGDEILVMQNDFPTNILPWLGLSEKGVNVRQVLAKEKVLQPQELLGSITPKTKLFCISHVHTFSGIITEIESFSRICRDHNVLFVLNLSQSVGTMPIDLSRFHVDAVVAAGYKWLCGPYGTGFLWMQPKLRESLQNNLAYWISSLTEEELQSEGPLGLKAVKSARRFDVFGTANFFNFVPFRSAIDYWLTLGLDRVRSCHDQLIDQFIAGLDQNKFAVISPLKGPARSSLVVISHKNRQMNRRIHSSLLGKGIYTALWKNNIRVAPHVYNTPREIVTLLNALNQF